MALFKFLLLKVSSADRAEQISRVLYTNLHCRIMAHTSCSQGSTCTYLFIRFKVQSIHFSVTKNWVLSNASLDCRAAGATQRTLMGFQVPLFQLHLCNSNSFLNWKSLSHSSLFSWKHARQHQPSISHSQAKTAESESKWGRVIGLFSVSTCTTGAEAGGTIVYPDNRETRLV